MSKENFAETPERILEKEFDEFAIFNPGDKMEEFMDK